jgi:hypothetical protein
LKACYKKSSFFFTDGFNHHSYTSFRAQWRLMTLTVRNARLTTLWQNTGANPFGALLLPVYEFLCQGGMVRTKTLKLPPTALTLTCSRILPKGLALQTLHCTLYSWDCCHWEFTG